MPVMNTAQESIGRLRCLQAGCGKEFTTPLEIFDGKLVCPHCGRELAKSEFTVTKHNDDLTRLGEMYFGEYLSRSYAQDKNGNYISGGELTGAETRLREKLLIGARSAFLEASRQGHPYATMMLGYFWSVGYMGRGSDLDRYKMAFHYYNNVCTTASVNVITDGDEREIGGYVSGREGKLLEVRREAANKLLELIVAMPTELSAKKRGQSAPYSLATNVARMKELELIVDFSSKNVGGVSQGTSRREIERTLDAAIKNADHTPVFGYFILQRYEFMSLYEEGEEEKSLFKSCIRRGKNLEIYYAASPKEIEESAKFYRMGATGLKEEFLEEESDEVYLFFINNAPKVGKEFASVKARMSEGKRGDIRRALVGNFGAGVDALMCAEERLAGHIFYPEDIFFATKRSKQRPVEGLREYLEVEWNNET